MEASGQAKYETTAAIAETETSTARLAEKVHQNAETAQDVAKQAAFEALHHTDHSAAKPASEATTAANAVSRSPAVAGVAEHAKDVAAEAAHAAQTKGPGVTGELKDVVPAAKATTDAAVEEGKRDVNSAVIAGQGYLQQAINVASGALASAQSYVAGAAGHVDEASGTTRGGTTGSGTTSTGTSAVDTAKQYAAQAQSVAQPHIEAAAKAIQSGAATTVQAAQNYLANSNISGVSSQTVPSKTAPLESGSHTTDSVYPESGDAKKHGENA